MEQVKKMTEVPYTPDPEDASGRRCEELNGDFKCHRKLDHKPNTVTLLKQEDEEDRLVEFNHRTLAGGRYFTW